MRLIDELITCEDRATRVEIYPIGDAHIGKRNCDEHALRTQVLEMLRRSRLPNRHVRAVLGGDIINAINTADVKRFDFDELADWFVSGSADETRERLRDMVSQEIERAVSILQPIKHLILGAITGNHENTLKRRQNLDVHATICRRLDIPNLTDEALIRFRFKRLQHTTVSKLYIRHGYGSGRTPGAEPNKLARMLAEWETADVCLSGHSHTFCIQPPKAVLHLASGGKLPTRLPARYRFAGNWGCWLLSHLVGAGSYESGSCYEAKPMTTLKVVIWPAWRSERNGLVSEFSKIELREYPIL